MRSIRNILTAVVTGAIVYGFLSAWMHAPGVFAFAVASVLGVLVLIVTGSAPSEQSHEADEAWLRAAPDLPPVSDRAALARMRPVRPPAPPRSGAEQNGRSPAPPRSAGDSAGPGAEPRPASADDGQPVASAPAAGQIGGPADRDGSGR